MSLHEWKWAVRPFLLSQARQYFKNHVMQKSDAGQASKHRAKEKIHFSCSLPNTVQAARCTPSSGSHATRPLPSPWPPHTDHAAITTARERATPQRVTHNCVPPKAHLTTCTSHMRTHNQSYRRSPPITLLHVHAPDLDTGMPAELPFFGPAWAQVGPTRSQLHRVDHLA